MLPYVNEMDLDFLHTYIRIGLGSLFVLLSLLGFIGTCTGGVHRFCCPTRSGGAHRGCYSVFQWLLVLGCSFLSGYLFLATIGAGMGVTTFFALSVFLGIETRCGTRLSNN